VFKDDASVICECCEQATDMYYCGSVYCVADVNYLCPHCIASGAAAAKFDAGFIQNADPLPPGVADAKSKTEELFKALFKRLGLGEILTYDEREIEL